MQDLLAIDFGTSNSLVGAVTKKQVYSQLPLDPSAPDQSIMRTLLYFPNADTCFYGTQALQEFINNEMDGRLFRSFKAHLPSSNYLGSMIERRPLPIEQMVGLFLLELKKRSESHLQMQFDRVLLGRPARYSADEVSHQLALHRMTKAAEFAGFKHIEFLEEPIAASYSIQKSWQDEKTILIVDLGGGTSDFTVVKVAGNKDRHKHQVLGVTGVSVAGDALDASVMEHGLAPFFGSKLIYKVPLSENVLQMPPGIHMKLCHPAHITHLKEPDTYNFLKNTQKWALREEDKKALARLFVLMDDQQIFSLFEEIEKSKRKISEQDVVDFDFPYPDIEIKTQFKAQDFAQWIDAKLKTIMSSLEDCLKQAGLAASQIDYLCLTGGTTKVDLIQHELKRKFGPEKITTSALFHSVLHGLVEAGRQRN